MPSGYEKSPDYGGREIGPVSWAVIVALAVAVSAAPVGCVLLTRAAKPAAAPVEPSVTLPAEQAADPR